MKLSKSKNAIFFASPDAPHIPGDLRYVGRLIQSVSLSGEYNPAQFPGGNQTITITLSEIQFRELLSALMAGADLLYPEKSHDVVWSLLYYFEHLP